MSVILDAVEQEAAQLRLESRAEAREYLHASRDRADQLVEVRQERISQLTDELIEKAEAVVARLEDAAPVREGFDNLVRALGSAAERLSHEAERTHDDFEPRSFHAELADRPPSPTPDRPASNPETDSADDGGREQQTAPPAPIEPPSGPAPSGSDRAQPPVIGPPPVAGSGAAGASGPLPRPTLTQPLPPFPPVGSSAPPPQPSPEAARAAVDTSSQVGASGIRVGDQVPEPRPAAVSSSNPGAGPDAGTVGGWRDLDEGRRIAIQLAAQGRTRGQVRSHLQQRMGIGDFRRILGEIFGAGSADDATVPWSAQSSD